MKYYFYKCPLCNDILRRKRKVKESICGKKGERVKLKRLNKKTIKKYLTNCHEDSRCECEFYDETNERCIYFDGNEELK